MKSSPCTTADSSLVQTSSLSAGDNKSNLDSGPSDKSVSSHCITDEKLCKSESSGGICKPENDSKCTTVCSADGRPKSDRSQRREKRPDIQLYVPKPRQLPQQGPSRTSASSAVNVKVSDHRTSPQLETNSDQKKNRELPSEHKESLEPLPQSCQSKSVAEAEYCSSASLKYYAASLPPDSFGDLTSASKTVQCGDSSKPMPAKVKQKVSKPVKSQSNESQQESSDCSVSASGKGDKRGKHGDSICSERLDWDFCGEFEYNRDGVSWGDLPPPSDHDSSDEEINDDSGVHSRSATNAHKQKQRKPRGSRRRGTKKKQMQTGATSEDVEDVGAPDGKLAGNSVNSRATVKAGGSESTKAEKSVVVSCRLAENRESAEDCDRGPSKNYDTGADGQCSGKVSAKSYSHSCRQKAGKPHLVVDTERRTESLDQRHCDRSVLQSGTSSKESENIREETSRQQRPDSGRIGGIIRLPVGTVTTTSHNAAPSVQSRVSMSSARGRTRRLAHGSSGRRALLSPDKLESLSAKQHQDSHAQHRPAYPADYTQYYQRQSATPQLYYGEYPPVSGASPMPPVDGYVYGYPIAYDGLGYVDDSSYH